MGPTFQAAREPRRSSRRPTCTPASRSPPNHLVPALASPRTPTTPAHILPPPVLKSNNNSSKRVKQEPEDTRTPMDDATIPTTNGRAKRKTKDKVEVVLPPPIVPDPPAQDVLMPDAQDENDDDGGITRCVCGRTETDEEDLAFMVMCETCKAWQHGICVNFRSEDVADQDYYCEQCRPDLHVELLKSLKKRVRHTSHASQPNARRLSASVPRSSRSHSPGHVLATAPTTKAPKRRNTMNSRDAAYEDALKQLIESTRPDAGGDADANTEQDEHVQQEEPTVIYEIVSGARKKRKRPTVEKGTPGSVKAELVDPSAPPKRNRSNSSTPDQPIAITMVHRNGPINGATTNGDGAPARHTSTSSGVGTKQNAVAGPSKTKRGRKEATASADTTDGTSSKKHPNQYTYRKPPNSGPPGCAGVHDHGTRRNPHSHAPPPAAPQPLLTSWGLPDYLSHLASVLPSDVPRPVAVAVEAGDGDEKVLERGVKVKWPAKRTSVVDMNKRVRGIIDWVGREQAVAIDRRRRRDALSKALREQRRGTGDADGEGAHAEEQRPDSGTTQLMEDLMKELIAFQEKFGPGAKGKERERRAGG